MTKRELITLIELECKPNPKTLMIHNSRAKRFMQIFNEEYELMHSFTLFIDKKFFNEKYRVLKYKWLEYPKCLNPDCFNKIKKSNKKICGNKCSIWIVMDILNKKHNTNYTNIMQFQEIKIKQSLNIKKAYEDPSVMQKRKETNMKRYGVEHHMQNKEQMGKIKSKLIENHGGVGFASDKIFKKVKETNLNKYGFEYSLQNQDVRNRQIKTNLEIYGVEHVLMNKEVRNKIKEGNVVKYGAENVFSSAEIKNKIKKSNLNKYGFENPSSAKTIKDKKRKTFESKSMWLTMDKKTDFEHYSSLVESITKQQAIELLENFENRGQYNFHLDHKFSKFEGFKQNIPPFIIGGIKNLEFIPWKENLTKHRNCSITIDDIT